MNDYASAPSEPIVQGLITVGPSQDGPGPVHFEGMGVSSIIRSTVSPQTPVVSAVGDYTLTLDAGVPGDVAIDPDLGRTMLNIRGSLTAAGQPGGTTIDQKAISYLVSLIPGVGADKVRVVLSAAGVATDPIGASGNGCEIIIRRGNVTNPNFNQQLIGPLFQPVTPGP